MSARANTTNSLGIGVSQVSGGNIVPINTYVTTFPRPSGLTITATRVNAEMAAAGTTVGTVLERGSDGGFWDTTNNVRVPCDYTSLQNGNDMVSA